MQRRQFLKTSLQAAFGAAAATLPSIYSSFAANAQSYDLIIRGGGLLCIR